MDAKVTLSFDSEVIAAAKKYAESKKISLSRLTEILLRRLVAEKPYSLEEYQVEDWVQMVAEGPASYNTQRKKNKELRKEYRER